MRLGRACGQALPPLPSTYSSGGIPYKGKGYTRRHPAPLSLTPTGPCPRGVPSTPGSSLCRCPTGVEEEQPSDVSAGAPQPPVRTRAQKRALWSLSCRSIFPGRGRECSSQPQPTPTTSAWTWGGWEAGRKDELEPTQDRTWHSAPVGSTNQLVTLWICGQRVGFRFSNTREEPVTMPWRWRGGTGRRGGAGARETEMAAEGKRASCVARESFLQTDSMLQGPQPHASNTTPR